MVFTCLRWMLSQKVTSFSRGIKKKKKKQDTEVVWLRAVFTCFLSPHQQIGSSGCCRVCVWSLWYFKNTFCSWFGWSGEKTENTKTAWPCCNAPHSGHVDLLPSGQSQNCPCLSVLANWSYISSVLDCPWNPGGSLKYLNRKSVQVLSLFRSGGCGHFDITPFEYFTVERLLLTFPHFFRCAIWLRGFSSVAHIISAELQWSFVPCLVTSQVSAFPKARLRSLDTIWGADLKSRVLKSCHKCLDMELQTCRCRSSSQELSCMGVRSWKNRFQILSGNSTFEAKLGFCLKYELYRGFSVGKCRNFTELSLTNA